MPAGGCVLPYHGKRGTTWFVKYLDAAGRQVKERLGSERDGWNRRKAKAELRARLIAVERNGYRKPEPTTFRTFADGFCRGAHLRASLRDERGPAWTNQPHALP